MNPEFAGISKHSESNLGKKGYKKGLGSLSWVRKYLNWVVVGTLISITLVILFYPITLTDLIIGIITGAFSGVVAEILILVQK